MSNNNHDAFISHSSREKEIADAVVTVLEQSGIKCWVAPRDINPGISYPAQIVGAIRTCRVFVVLVSEMSGSSEHVSSELERAFDYKKMIIPFLIKETEFSDEQLYFLSRKQQIDAYSNFESGLETLKSTLLAFLESGNASSGSENVKETIACDEIQLSAPSSLLIDKKQKFLSKIQNESINKYEVGFSNSLLNFIKHDEMLDHFYERLIYECENVIRVIESARRVDVLELEEIIVNLSNASDIDTLSKQDSEFHKRLFAITGDDDFFDWYLKQSKGLSAFITMFWKSIGYNTEPFHKLIEIHQQIFQAIKDKNIENALAAMEKHFAFLLFQLLGNIYASN